MEEKVWLIITRVAVVLAVGISIATLGVFFYDGVKLVKSDICETRGQEPLIIAGVLKIMNGSQLYTHLNEMPFDVMQYTPLYYYLTALAAKGGANDPEYVTRVGRMLSLSFSLIHLLVFFGILVRLLKVPVWLASVASALVYVLHAPWDFLARPDALVSLLFISSIGLALWAFEDGQSPKKKSIALLVVSLFGFVAFMTKQNGAQIVVILLVYLLTQRDWYRALVVTILPSFLLCMSILIAPFVFGGNYAANAIGGLNNGVRPYAAFIATYIPVFLEFNIAALCAVAVYFVTGWFKEISRGRDRFLAIAFVVTFVLAALSATKLGSAPNHYNDLMTLLIVVLAHGIHDASRNDLARETKIKWAVSVFVFTFFSSQTVLFGKNFSDVSWRRFASYQPVALAMKGRLDASPDAKFFTVDYTLANFFPGKVVIPQYTLSGIMFARGLVDYSIAQKMMDSGEVQWILAGTQQDIVRQLGFVGLQPNHFKREAEVDGFAIWTFDPTANTTTSR